MSYSSKVKSELKIRIDSARHCRIAEIASILALNGYICDKDGCIIEAEQDGYYEPENSYLCLVTENITLAEKFMMLLGKTYDLGDNNIVVKYEGDKNKRYRLLIKSENLLHEILMAIKWEDKKICKKFAEPMILQKECCRKAFIRGAFLAAGSLSDPNKSYHLEIVLDSEDKALQLQKLMLGFELDAKIVERKRNFVVYIKEGANITDCLNLMGAYVSQMELYNVMILKDMRNDVNRKVNCETANLNKTIEAAVKQIKDIEYIRDTVGLDYLKPQLAAVAQVRLENPDMNLASLGEMLDPVVGKSGVNHRLRKISEIAEELRGQG